MSTVLVDSSATELHPQSDTPTDATRMRARPTASPDTEAAALQRAADADVDESPIARLVLARERAQHAARPTHDDTAQKQASRAAGLPVTALTNDARFAVQLRAALDGIAEVTIVSTTDEAAALAASHRCPILVTDVTLTRTAIEALTVRLRAHDPASVLIVAGSRDQGGAFISLQSSGAVGGFLLKPATSAATQLVVESATKRYRTQTSEGTDAEPARLRVRTRTPRTNRTHAPALVDAADRETPTIEAHVPPRATHTVAPAAATQIPPPKPPLSLASWALATAVAVVVGVAVWWVMWQRMPDIDPQQVIAEHLARAESAQLAGRWVGPRNSAAYHFQTVLALDPQNLPAQRGLDGVAAELSRQTQSHMSQRRLADAIASLERLRDLKPDYAELPLLDSQLALLRDAVLATHAPAPAVDTAPTRGVESPAPERMKLVRSVESTKLAGRPGSPPGPRPSVTKPVDAKADLATQPVAKAVSAPSAPSLIMPPATLLDTPAAPAAPSPTATTASATPGPAPAENAAPTPAAHTAAPAILKYVEPTYPSEAYARGIEGWVQVNLSVTPNGSVASARIEDGEKRRLFARAALSAVRQWKYTPRPEANGETPVSVRLDFRLNR